MPPATYKQRERDSAAFWGTKRAANNSSGRDDFDGSDSVHERLHIETKLRKTNLRSLWEKAKAKAMKFRIRKTPVLMVAQKNCPGFLICVHSDDFRHAVKEWLVCQDERVLNQIVTDVRLLQCFKETNGD
jgi:hypothetical protein